LLLYQVISQDMLSAEHLAMDKDHRIYLERI